MFYDTYRKGFVSVAKFFELLPIRFDIIFRDQILSLI